MIVQPAMLQPTTRPVRGRLMVRTEGTLPYSHRLPSGPSTIEGGLSPSVAGVSRRTLGNWADAISRRFDRSYLWSIEASHLGKLIPQVGGSPGWWFGIPTPDPEGREDEVAKLAAPTTLAADARRIALAVGTLARIIRRTAEEKIAAAGYPAYINSFLGYYPSTSNKGFPTLETTEEALDAHLAASRLWEHGEKRVVSELLSRSNSERIAARRPFAALFSRTGPNMKATPEYRPIAVVGNEIVVQIVRETTGRYTRRRAVFGVPAAYNMNNVTAAECVKYALIMVNCLVGVLGAEATIGYLRSQAEGRRLSSLEADISGFDRSWNTDLVDNIFDSLLQAGVLSEGEHAAAVASYRLPLLIPYGAGSALCRLVGFNSGNRHTSSANSIQGLSVQKATLSSQNVPGAADYIDVLCAWALSPDAIAAAERVGVAFATKVLRKLQASDSRTITVAELVGGYDEPSTVADEVRTTLFVPYVFSRLGLLLFQFGDDSFAITRSYAEAPPLGSFLHDYVAQDVTVGPYTVGAIVGGCGYLSTLMGTDVPGGIGFVGRAVQTSIFPERPSILDAPTAAVALATRAARIKGHPGWPDFSTFWARYFSNWDVVNWPMDKVLAMARQHPATLAALAHATAVITSLGGDLAHDDTEVVAKRVFLARRLLQ